MSDHIPATAQIGSAVFAMDDPRIPELTRSAMQRGRYEFKEREIASRLLETGDRVIELGTGMGTVCLNVAKIVGADAVVGFEANAAIADLARQNARLNGLNVVIRNAIPKPFALEPAAGEMDFFAFRSFEASSTRKLAPNLTAIKVPTVVLEQEIRAHHANVLVFDIEGFENEIITFGDFEGIDKVVAELHPGIIGRDCVLALIAILEARGLRLVEDLIFGNVVAFRRTAKFQPRGPALFSKMLELEDLAGAGNASEASQLAEHLVGLIPNNSYLRSRVAQIPR